MNQSFSLLLLFVIACARISNVSGNEENWKVLESDQNLDHHTRGWKQLHPPEPKHPLHLTFALKQRNVNQLENLLLQVSDPDSPNYGRYLTVDELTHLVSPSDESVGVVSGWLESHGVATHRQCNLTLNRDFMTCMIPCAIAELLLPGSRFYNYQHDQSEHLLIRSSSQYQVPVYIAQHLDFIGGTSRLPNIKSLSKGTLNQRVRRRNDFHVGIYPKVLRKTYKLSNSDVGSHPNNSQSVAGFLDQYFQQGDLSEFMSLFVGNDFVHRTAIDKIIGPNHGRSKIEATLDTQYITGMGANITTWFWSTAGRHDTEEPFLKWLVDVGNTTHVPFVHSISYGEGENIVSKSYMQRVNVEFMKLGLRGVSVICSSGDDGAGCVNKTRFNPHFPASSPYVTAVGGTRFWNPFGGGKELAYEISGGGFSDTFQQPKYQQDAVAKFLKSSQIPPQRYFNAVGRAYPDVSALCRHFWVVINKIPMPGVQGTSASAPTVAGIISMLNEHRLQQKKPTMGFLNPFLYKNPEALNDVTGGYNEGCLAHDRGFYATEGYDTVTGYGTPNFPKLVKAAMKVVSR